MRGNSQQVCYCTETRAVKKKKRQCDTYCGFALYFKRYLNVIVAWWDKRTDHGGLLFHISGSSPDLAKRSLNQYCGFKNVAVKSIVEKLHIKENVQV